jgi:hypothetical protein
MENFTWFSDKPDSRLGNVVVLLPENNNTDYYALTARINLIWKYVWEKLDHTNYDWFSRTWDDNYIIPEEMMRIAFQYNSSDLVEVGRIAEYNGDRYVGGGASSLVSRALVKKHVESGRVASMQPTFEDYTVSMVRRELGAQFFVEHGFLHLAPDVIPKAKNYANITPSELACRCSYKEEGRANFSRPVTFHYVQKESMPMIYRALYHSPCLLKDGMQDSGFTWC